MSVKLMREEMRRLGHVAEAKAAKRSAVRTALEFARANPREVTAAAEEASSDEDASSGDESAADDEELDGDDVHEVQARFCIESVPSGREW